MQHRLLAARIAVTVAAVAMGVLVVQQLGDGFGVPSRELAPEQSPAEPTAATSTTNAESVAPVPPPPPVARTEEYTIQKGDTVGKVLESRGFLAVRDLVKAAKPHVNLADIRPGDVFTFEFLGEEVQEFRYQYEEDSTLVVKAADVTNVVVEKVEYERDRVRVKFAIDSSLWSAAKSLGFRANQILEVAKVFENELDMNTDLRAGASVEAVVETLRVDGEFVRFGDIDAVTMVNAGKTYSAFYFSAEKESETGWYSREGKSLDRFVSEAPRSASQRALGPPFKRGAYKRYQTNLKRYPLKDGELSIGSDFYQKRCGGRCRHSALDIRAAQGTPLVAMGDGVVRAITGASSLCGFGIQIETRDDSGQRWRTLYCHMSKITVKRGQTVKKGQSVGLSGGTPGTYGSGNTTAPHLHLELRQRTKNGRWALVDPLPQIGWAPFTTRVRYTKGYEPKAKRPAVQPPVNLKGDSLARFQAAMADTESVVEPFAG